MIAFGSAITSPDMYHRCAEPGIRLVEEPDSEVLARPAKGSIFASYNSILDEAAELPDLEALVLLHQDSEIVDRRFCPTLRDALSDPQVGVVGCAGAIGVRSIAWWDGSITWASFNHRYEELGGGYSPSYTWISAQAPAYAQLGEVDALDGFMLALSPWVVRNVRFDESFGQMLHGYDFDLCLQVRAAGRKVTTADLKVVHHHPIFGSDLVQWARAHISLAEKWDGKMPNIGVAPGNWRQRARRAEAETAIVRAQAITRRLRVEALSGWYEQELAVMETSLGWRLTAPLRRLHALGRARRAARDPVAIPGARAGRPRERPATRP